MIPELRFKARVCRPTHPHSHPLMQRQHVCAQMPALHVFEQTRPTASDVMASTSAVLSLHCQHTSISCTVFAPFEAWSTKARMSSTYCKCIARTD